MDATEKWHQIVGYFMEMTTRAKTADEKRRIILAAVNAVDAAYADRPKRTPREANFEAIRRFAEGAATLSTLHEAGRRVRSAMGDFAANPKLYGFTTAAHWLATVAVVPNDEVDGGFSVVADELPFIMGWLTYGRPLQGNVLHWEQEIDIALTRALDS